MRDSAIEALIKLASEDKNFTLLTGDLGFKIFDEYQKRFPNQFLNCGIAEQNMIGLATGMALMGAKICVYSIGNFPSLRCLEQIRNDVLYHNAHVNIITSGAGFSYGVLGMSHHATEDAGIISSLPRSKVISPACSFEAFNAIYKNFKNSGGHFVRLEKNDKNTEKLNKTFEIGRCRILKNGKDISIIAMGSILNLALEASSILLQKGIECGVVSFHTIKPFDKAGLHKIASNSKKILIIEEHNNLSGLSSIIYQELFKLKKFDNIVENLGIPDEYTSVVGDQNYLREKVGISLKSIILKIEKMIS